MCYKHLESQGLQILLQKTKSSHSLHLILLAPYCHRKLGCSTSTVILTDDDRCPLDRKETTSCCHAGSIVLLIGLFHLHRDSSWSSLWAREVMAEISERGETKTPHLIYHFIPVRKMGREKNKSISSVRLQERCHLKVQKNSHGP